jgi:DNA primase
MIAIANSRETLIQEITANGGEYLKDSSVLCWHGETKPSGHIKQCDDGRWRYKCFGCGFGGDEHDIRMVRTGERFKDLVVNDNPQKKTEPKESIAYTGEQIKSFLDQIGTNRVTYRYRDIQGRLIGIVVRIQLTEEDKTFRQITPVGKDRFYFQGPKEKWPLYKIQDTQAGTVILVEGEQCADLLREMV